MEAGDEPTVDHVGDAERLLLDRPLAQHERELHPQQLVEHEPAPRGALRVHRLGSVDRPKRVLPTLEVEPLQHRCRHRIGDATHAAARERRLHPTRDLPCRQPGLLRLWVHRHDAPGAIADEVDDRIRHGEPPSVRLDPTEERDLETRRTAGARARPG